MEFHCISSGSDVSGLAAIFAVDIHNVSLANSGCVAICFVVDSEVPWRVFATGFQSIDARQSPTFPNLAFVTVSTTTTNSTAVRATRPTRSLVGIPLVPAGREEAVETQSILRRTSMYNLPP